MEQKEENTQRLFTQAEQTLLEEIILHRRDVRGNRFIPRSISEEALDKILFAAMNAPSVGFSQPWKFVIITEPATKEAVKGSFEKENKKAARLFENEKQQEYIRLKLEGITEAPLNMAVFYSPSKEPVLGQSSMPEVGKYSVVCAIQNMWLMARSLNIGMGWVSILDPEKVKQILRVPEENVLIGYLCFGYTDMFYNQPELELRKWDKRKLKDHVVIYEKYNAS
jgi:5,6-dimethylbenzimidazole synthase